MKYQIIVDNRERRPLFTKNVSNETLKTGDYSFIFDGHNFKNEFAIEYKAPPDAVGTVLGGHVRFKKELLRANELDYFAIVISCLLTDLQSGNFKGSEHMLARSTRTAVKIFDTLQLKYEVPVFYVDGRVEAKHKIRSLIEDYIEEL